MDRVSIRDLRVETRIGVTEAERAAPRPLSISVDIWTDLAEPGKSDELSDTVDYGAAAVAVADLVRSREANLLEHVAENVAELLLQMDGVQGVSVEVVKDSPPIAEEVRSVSVQIDRPPR